MGPLTSQYLEHMFLFLILERCFNPQGARHNRKSIVSVIVEGLLKDCGRDADTEFSKN